MNGHTVRNVERLFSGRGALSRRGASSSSPFLWSIAAPQLDCSNLYPTPPHNGGPEAEMCRKYSRNLMQYYASDVVAKCIAQSSSNYISSQTSGLNKRCKRPALTPRSPLFRGSGPVSQFLTHNRPTRARRSEVMLGLPTAPCCGVLLQCAPGSSESHASAASTAKMELGDIHAQCKPVERERKKGGETPLLTSVGFQQAHGSMPLHHSFIYHPIFRTGPALPLRKVHHSEACFSAPSGPNPPVLPWQVVIMSKPILNLRLDAIPCAAEHWCYRPFRT